MVSFCNPKLSDIDGMVNLNQIRHINKHISEQTNINLYITQQSNKRVHGNGFNIIEPFYEYAPGSA